MPASRKYAGGDATAAAAEQFIATELCRPKNFVVGWRHHHGDYMQHMQERTKCARSSAPRTRTTLVPAASIGVFKLPCATVMPERVRRSMQLPTSGSPVPTPKQLFELAMKLLRQRQEDKKAEDVTPCSRLHIRTDQFMPLAPAGGAATGIEPFCDAAAAQMKNQSKKKAPPSKQMAQPQQRGSPAGGAVDDLGLPVAAHCSRCAASTATWQAASRGIAQCAPSARAVNQTDDAIDEWMAGAAAATAAAGRAPDSLQRERQTSSAVAAASSAPSRFAQARSSLAPDAARGRQAARSPGHARGAVSAACAALAIDSSPVQQPNRQLASTTTLVGNEQGAGDSGLIESPMLAAMRSSAGALEINADAATVEEQRHILNLIHMENREKQRRRVDAQQSPAAKKRASANAVSTGKMSIHSLMQ